MTGVEGQTLVKLMPVTQINTSDPTIKLKQMLKDET